MAASLAVVCKQVEQGIELVCVSMYDSYRVIALVRLRSTSSGGISLDTAPNY